MGRAYLVVNFLLNGISAEDDSADLQARLEAQPEDLEDCLRGNLGDD